MEDTILKTQRLILRYQRKSDIKFLVDLWMDEDMTRYTGGPRDKTALVEEFRRIADEPRKMEYDLWPVELKNTHELVGYAGFIPKEIKGKECLELNYYIDKAKWGKGYAKEMAGKLVAYAFAEEGLERLIAIIDPENEASKAVARAIGMRYWMNEERSGKTKSIYMIKKEGQAATDDHTS